MNSKVFGLLNPADFDIKTAFEGRFRVLGKQDSDFTIRGHIDAEPLLEWAEERYRLFQSNLNRIKQTIKDWIPEFYIECGFEFTANRDKLIDALQIDTFNFVKKKKGSEIWFYSNVEDGIDDDDHGPLSGHDIVAHFNDKMEVIAIHIDG